TSSDARFKREVVEIEGALAMVRALRGVRFDWKRDEFPQRGFAQGRQVGFIAQEVEETLPEVVSRDSEGYLAIDYAKVTPVLAEAVRELADQTDAQRQEIETLRGRVSELEAVRGEIETLKSQIAALMTR